MATTNDSFDLDRDDGSNLPDPDRVQLPDPNQSRGAIEWPETWERKVLNTRGLSDPNLAFVPCPEHPHHLMTPIKVHSHRYGDSLTLQCHHTSELGDMCLIIIEMTKTLAGSRPYYRPGDILKHENWKKAYEYVLHVNRESVIDAPQSQASLKVTKAPPNPWNKKGTMSYFLWDQFWTNIVHLGYCEIESVKTAWASQRGSSQAKRLYREIETLPEWMRRRTGYVIKVVGLNWEIVGRAVGREDVFPWSEESYREEFYSLAQESETE